MPRFRVKSRHTDSSSESDSPPPRKPLRKKARNKASDSDDAACAAAVKAANTSPAPRRAIGQRDEAEAASALWPQGTAPSSTRGPLIPTPPPPSIVIDWELRRCLPALSPLELHSLHDSLALEGCRNPVVLWGEILVDGYYRILFCQANNIPFQCIQIEQLLGKPLAKEDVEGWMDRNQLARRNIGEYLKGTGALKMRAPLSEAALARQYAGRRADHSKGSTRDQLAALAHTSTGTMRKVMAIHSSAPPRVQGLVAQGRITVSDGYQAVRTIENTRPDIPRDVLWAKATNDLENMYFATLKQAVQANTGTLAAETKRGMFATDIDVQNATTFANEEGLAIENAKGLRPSAGRHVLFTHRPTPPRRQQPRSRPPSPAPDTKPTSESLQHQQQLINQWNWMMRSGQPAWDGITTPPGTPWFDKFQASLYNTMPAPPAMTAMPLRTLLPTTPSSPSLSPTPHTPAPFAAMLPTGMISTFTTPFASPFASPHVSPFTSPTNSPRTRHGIGGSTGFVAPAGVEVNGSMGGVALPVALRPQQP